MRVDIYSRPPYAIASGRRGERSPNERQPPGALGGGGYDIANVARAWTLAWAVMNDAVAPEMIPAAFLEHYAGAGFLNNRLRDESYTIEGPQKEMMRNDVERVLAVVRENIQRTQLHAGS